MTPKEELNKVRSQELKKSAGPDGISSSLLKRIVNGVCDNIARLINLIISTGNYLIHLGKGRIKPVYKEKGSDRN